MKQTILSICVHLPRHSEALHPPQSPTQQLNIKWLFQDKESGFKTISPIDLWQSYLAYHRLSPLPFTHYYFFIAASCMEEINERTLSFVCTSFHFCLGLFILMVCDNSPFKGYSQIRPEVVTRPINHITTLALDAHTFAFILNFCLCCFLSMNSFFSNLNFPNASGKENLLLVQH